MVRLVEVEIERVSRCHQNKEQTAASCRPYALRSFGCMTNQTLKNRAGRPLSGNFVSYVVVRGGFKVVVVRCWDVFQPLRDLNYADHFALLHHSGMLGHIYPLCPETLE